jgi:hypothetical protein
LSGNLPGLTMAERSDLIARSNHENPMASQNQQIRDKNGTTHAADHDRHCVCGLLAKRFGDRFVRERDFLQSQSNLNEPREERRRHALSMRIIRVLIGLLSTFKAESDR